MATEDKKFLKDIVKASQQNFDKVVTGTYSETETYDPANLYEVELGDPIILGAPGSGLNVNDNNELYIENAGGGGFICKTADGTAAKTIDFEDFTQETQLKLGAYYSITMVNSNTAQDTLTLKLGDIATAYPIYINNKISRGPDSTIVGDTGNYELPAGQYLVQFNVIPGYNAKEVATGKAFFFNTTEFIHGLTDSYNGVGQLTNRGGAQLGTAYTETETAIAAGKSDLINLSSYIVDIDRTPETGANKIKFNLVAKEILSGLVKGETLVFNRADETGTIYKTFKVTDVDLTGADYYYVTVSPTFTDTSITMPDAWKYFYLASSKAIGDYSISTGDNTKAIGDFSHAEGFGYKNGYTIYKNKLNTNAFTNIDIIPSRSSVYIRPIQPGFDNWVNKMFYGVSSDSPYEVFSSKITGVRHEVTDLEVVLETAVPSSINAFSTEYSLVAESVETSEAKPGLGAVGNYSHTEGVQAGATGEASHAEGIETIANGLGAHAEGYSKQTSEIIDSITPETVNINTIDSIVKDAYHITNVKVFKNEATNKVKVGDKVTTATFKDHTEEIYTVSFENCTIKSIYNDENTFTWEFYPEIYCSHGVEDTITSLSILRYNITTKTVEHGADGQYSHTEGKANSAIGHAAHAEGYNTLAVGSFSHTGGRDTVTGAKNRWQQNTDYIVGDAVYYETEPVTGVKVSKLYICKTAHRSGTTFSLTNWDELGNAGQHAEGERTFARGDFSHAEGQGPEYDERTPMDGIVELTNKPSANTTTKHLAVNCIGVTKDVTDANLYIFKLHASREDLAGTVTQITVVQQGVTVDFNSTQFTYTIGAEIGYGDVILASISKETWGSLPDPFDPDPTVQEAAKRGWSITKNIAADETEISKKQIGAIGNYSHIEGNCTDAEGAYAHAEGFNAKAEHWFYYDLSVQKIITPPVGASDPNVQLVLNGPIPEHIFAGCSLKVRHVTDKKVFMYQVHDRYTLQARVYLSREHTLYEDDDATNLNGWSLYTRGIRDTGTLDYSLTYTGAKSDYSHTEGWNTTAGLSKVTAYDQLSLVPAWAPNVQYVVGDKVRHSYWNGTKTVTDLYVCIRDSKTTVFNINDFNQWMGNEVFENAKSCFTYAHAQGEGTIAAKKAQTAIGKYNIEDTDLLLNKEYGEHAFIVGNGTDYEERSNAFTVDWDGRACAGIDQTADDYKFKEKELITIEYADNLSGGLVCKTAAKESDKIINYSPLTEYKLGAYYTITIVHGIDETTYTSTDPMTLNINEIGKRKIYINGKVAKRSSDTTKEPHNVTLPAGQYLVQYNIIEGQTSTAEENLYAFYFRTDKYVSGLTDNFDGIGKLSTTGGAQFAEAYAHNESIAAGKNVLIELKNRISKIEFTGNRCIRITISADITGKAQLTDIAIGDLVLFKDTLFNKVGRITAVNVAGPDMVWDTDIAYDSYPEANIKKTESWFLIQGGASGDHSISLGHNTRAKGAYSVAEGFGFQEGLYEYKDLSPAPVNKCHVPEEECYPAANQVVLLTDALIAVGNTAAVDNLDAYEYFSSKIVNVASSGPGVLPATRTLTLEDEIPEWIRDLRDQKTWAVKQYTSIQEEKPGKGAQGAYSHTEGVQTSATEEGAHAEGYLTNATGKYSHAEGSGNETLTRIKQNKYKQTSDTFESWLGVSASFDTEDNTRIKVVNSGADPLTECPIKIRAVVNVAGAVKYKEFLPLSYKVIRTEEEETELILYISKAEYQSDPNLPPNPIDVAEWEYIPSGITKSSSTGKETSGANGYASHTEGRFGNATGEGAHSEGYSLRRAYTWYDLTVKKITENTSAKTTEIIVATDLSSAFTDPFYLKKQIIHKVKDKEFNYTAKTLTWSSNEVTLGFDQLLDTNDSKDFSGWKIYSFVTPELSESANDTIAGAKAAYSHAEGYKTQTGISDNESNAYIESLNTWEPDKNYAIGDVVKYVILSTTIANEYKAYKCKVAHKSTSTFDTAKWDQVYISTITKGNGGAKYSHAQNEGTIATTQAQTVIGRYNEEELSLTADTSKANYGEHALIVGNGADEAHRSNAFTVDWRGSAQIGADQLASGYVFNEKELVSKEYFDANAGGGYVCLTDPGYTVKTISYSSLKQYKVGAYYPITMEYGHNVASPECLTLNINNLGQRYIYVNGERAIDSNAIIAPGQYLVQYELPDKADKTKEDSYVFNFRTDKYIEGITHNFNGTGTITNVGSVQLGDTLGYYEDTTKVIVGGYIGKLDIGEGILTISADQVSGTITLADYNSHQLSKVKIGNYLVYQTDKVTSYHRITTVTRNTTTNTVAITFNSYRMPSDADKPANYQYWKVIQGGAIGEYSTAIGRNVRAYGNYSHAEGCGGTDDFVKVIDTTPAILNKSTVSWSADNKVIISGYTALSSTENITAVAKLDGAEVFKTAVTGYAKYGAEDATVLTLAMTIPDPLKLGFIWDLKTVELDSAVEYGEGAIGDYSHTEGNQTTAIGESAHAEGYATLAKGECSHAEGYTAKEIIHTEKIFEAPVENTDYYELKTDTKSGALTGIMWRVTTPIGSQIAPGDRVRFTFTFPDSTTEVVERNIVASVVQYAEFKTNWLDRPFKTVDTATLSKIEYLKDTGNTRETDTVRYGADGEWSHTEGLSTIAIGEGAHAEGSDSTEVTEIISLFNNSTGGLQEFESSKVVTSTIGATGKYSHTEGYLANASGAGSHDEGGYSYESTNWRWQRIDFVNSISTGTSWTNIGLSIDWPWGDASSKQSKRLRHWYNNKCFDYGYTGSGDGLGIISFGGFQKPDDAATYYGWEIYVELPDNPVDTIYGAKGNYSHTEGSYTQTGLRKSTIRSLIDFADTWSSNTSYAVGALVRRANRTTHEGILYRCKEAHTSTTVFDYEKWENFNNAENAHAQNEGTIAARKNQTAIGMFNEEDLDSSRIEGKYAFIIGNGTSEDVRSNALTVSWNGVTNSTGGYTFLTSEPTSANTSGGLIPVYLASEPSAYYDGYIYYIKK